MYAACVSDDKQTAPTNPFGALYAASHMLKHVFNLRSEADCLLTSIQNVLEAGWRTADLHTVDPAMYISPEAVCGLISEQIELAGTLIQ